MSVEMNKMVTVKFNAHTYVHMMPDSAQVKEKETLQKMRYEDYKSFQQRLLAGSPYEIKEFKIGEVAEIPSWYYKEHKNDTVKVSVAIDNFIDRNRQRIPFLGDEAVKHNYIENPEDTMKTVKRFEKA